MGALLAGLWGWGEGELGPGRQVARRQGELAGEPTGAASCQPQTDALVGGPSPIHMEPPGHGADTLYFHFSPREPRIGLA